MGAAAETEMVGLAQLTRRSKKSSVGKISALKLCFIWSERCRNNETPPKNVVSLAEKTKLALLSTCCCVLFQRLRADSSIEKSTWGTDYGGKCACSGKKKTIAWPLLKNWYAIGNWHARLPEKQRYLLLWPYGWYCLCSVGTNDTVANRNRPVHEWPVTTL